MAYHPPSRRLVVSNIARGGHGKTQFLLSGPRPNLLISCDPNTEDVVCNEFKVRDSRDIDPAVLRVVHMRRPVVGFEANERQVMDDAYDGWMDMIDVLKDVDRGQLKPMPKVVSIDQGTDLDRLNILKEFGRTDKIAPATRKIKMGTINSEFKGIFEMLERAGVHVNIAHRCKEVWESKTIEHGRRAGETVDQVVPGEFERIGFKQMENIVNVEVLLMFDPKRDGALPDCFGMRVLKSNYRPSLVGKEYWGEADVDGQTVRCASFEYLGWLNFTSSRLDDWR